MKQITKEQSMMPGVIEFDTNWEEQYNNIKYTFLATRYYEGGDLKYGGNKNLTMESIKFYILQLLRTLSALHQREIIFCDLKGENLATEGGNLYVSVFEYSNVLVDRYWRS